MNLVHISNTQRPSLDGGYLGVGFYALVILHDANNIEAREAMAEVLSCSTPEKFDDDPRMRSMLRGKGWSYSDK